MFVLHLPASYVHIFIELSLPTVADVIHYSANFSSRSICHWIYGLVGPGKVAVVD